MLGLTACFGDGKDKAEEIPAPTDATIAPDAVNEPDQPAEEPTPNLGPDDAASQEPERPANIASLGKAAAGATRDVDAPPAPVAAATSEAPQQAAAASPAAAPAAVAPLATTATPATPETPAAADSKHEYLWALGDKVAVHSSPGRDGKEIGVLGFGERVEVLGHVHGFVKIGEGRYVMQRQLTDRKAHFYRHPNRETAH